MTAQRTCVLEELDTYIEGASGAFALTITLYQMGSENTPLDVDPSGDRFLTVSLADRTDDTVAAPRINVVLNFFDKLNELLPPGSRLLTVPETVPAGNQLPPTYANSCQEAADLT